MALHREKILEIYTRNGIEVNFNFNSPFRNLDLSGKSAKEVIAKFVALFADKGVNTIEDLCSNITLGNITLDDLLLKLKETFNSDSAIAACRVINKRDQEIIWGMKAQVIAKESDPDASVCSMLDQVAKKQRAFNMAMQTKLNPWRLENFKPEVHDLVEGKEKHPTPSQMFSIVSTLSEVARVEMSVIDTENELVCLILESQQLQTLKVFKRRFPDHVQKLCAYLYQLPIATQDRPLFHETDCTAVTEDLISNVSQLYYLNENAQSVLNSKLEKDLTTYNSRYDAYLLHYIGTNFPDYTRDCGILFGDWTYKNLLITLLGLVKDNVQLMRIVTQLNIDEITDGKIIVILHRLARHIVWCKNNRIEISNDPLEFIYTDGYVDENYYKNGPKGAAHLRNIWQFADEGPLLTKEQRLKILIHLPLLDYIECNPDDTSIKLRFRSALMLTFLSMLEFDIDGEVATFDGSALQGKYSFSSYLIIAMTSFSKNKEIPMVNLYIQKLIFSQYKLDKLSFRQFHALGGIVSNKDFKGIALLNMLNFSSVYCDYHFRMILRDQFEEICVDCEKYQYIEDDSSHEDQSSDDKVYIYSNARCFTTTYFLVQKRSS